jgi:hypothetical protein
MPAVTHIQGYKPKGRFYQTCNTCGSTIKRGSVAAREHEATSLHKDALAALGTSRPKAAHLEAITAIKDAINYARYRCTGEAAGILEAYVGGGAVPVILVQTYGNCDGIEVWQPLTQSIKTADTLEALKRVTDHAELHPSGSEQSKSWTPNPAECVRLCEALSAFWGYGVEGLPTCDAPIWPGAYLTEEDTPIRDLIRAAVGWRKP